MQALTTKSLLILPNHCINVANQQRIIESAELNLIQEASDVFGRVAIAAFQERREDTSLSAAVSDKDAYVYMLSPWSHTDQWSRKIANYSVATIRLIYLLKKFDALYIFCPSPTAMVAANLAMLAGQPFGLYVRGTWLTKNGETSNVWKKIFKRANFIIAAGEVFRRRLRPLNKNVATAVPLTQIDLPAKPRKNHTINNSTPVNLLYVGRVTERKGVFDVLRATAILNNAHPGRYSLLIAGGGTRENVTRLERLIRDLSLGQIVNFVGHLPPSKLIATLAETDVFVYPSYYPEGFPRVLYEAMMYSLPIVTCSLPGIDGYLINNINCLFTQPADHYGIAGCIAKLVDDAALAQRLGQCAYSTVSSTFAEFACASHAEQLARYFVEVFR